jgi:hypothetical protein
MNASLLSWILLLTGDAIGTLSAGGDVRQLSQAEFFRHATPAM